MAGIIGVKVEDFEEEICCFGRKGQLEREETQTAETEESSGHMLLIIGRLRGPGTRVPETACSPLPDSHYYTHIPRIGFQFITLKQPIRGPLPPEKSPVLQA